jgi:hypothetical protein
MSIDRDNLKDDSTYEMQVHLPAPDDHHQNSFLRGKMLQQTETKEEAFKPGFERQREMPLMTSTNFRGCDSHSPRAPPTAPPMTTPDTTRVRQRSMLPAILASSDLPAWLIAHQM